MSGAEVRAESMDALPSVQGGAIAKLSYRPDLDGLRAVAVFAVICSHSKLSWTGGGWMGVDIFFVLSGYLITTILLREHGRTGSTSLRNFYARRVLRLYPALLVMLILGIPFARVLGDGGTLTGYGRTAFASAIYDQNLIVGITGNAHGMLGHTWSLATEEQFYLLWPPLMVLLWNRGRSAFPWAFGCAIVSFVLLVCLTQPDPTTVPLTYYLPWTRFGTLLSGAVLALAIDRVGSVRVLQSKYVGWTAGFGMIGLMTAGSAINRNSGLIWEAPLIALLCFVLIAHLEGAGRRGIAALLGFGFLASIGRRSYGIYLFSIPIFAIFPKYFTLPPFDTLVSVIAISLAIAFASYRFVELPFLKLKARFSTG